MNNPFYKISKLTKQVILLLASNFILIFLGFGIKKIQTFQLGDLNYGEYAFFISIITFISLFFRFGFFVSLQNLLAQNHNENREKKLLAIGFTMALINGVAIAVSVWVLSFIVNDLFNTNIGYSLQIFAPLTIIYPFYFLFNAYGTGTNKIHINALYNVLPKALFLLFLIIYFEGLNLNSIIFFNFISTLIIIVFFFFKTRPNFSNFKFYWKILWLKNQKYGFHYYKGAIANQTTYKLDELFISFFKDTKLLGFYSLSLLVASPMIMVSQSINQSMFKQYSKLKKIPDKIFIYNTLWLLTCIILIFIFGEFVVNVLFGEEFKPVSRYAFLISFALFFHGMSTPYSFLAAKSKGIEIRNVAWSEAIINITGNLILIPLIGVEGAIITSIIAKATNYTLFRYYYNKYIAKIK